MRKNEKKTTSSRFTTLGADKEYYDYGKTRSWIMIMNGWRGMFNSNFHANKKNQ